MEQKFWITLLTYLSYCVDKELYKAIDYLKEQVRVLVEQQEKQNKPQPDGDYMKQAARILTDYEDGLLKGKRYLIHDRDPLYTSEFHSILKSTGVKPVKLPPRSPNLNSYAERFVKSVKSECLDHLILASVKQLEYAVNQYCE